MEHLNNVKSAPHSQAESVITSSRQFQSTPSTEPLSSTHKVGFLYLPFEIRLQIYHLLLPRDNLIEGENPSCQPREDILDLPPKYSNSILLANKQISDEALDILYASNTFRLIFQNKGESYFQQKFSVSNLQRMRKLIFTVGPYGGGYWTSQTPDGKFWSSILPNLTVLRFIVDQPLEFDSRENNNYECPISDEGKELDRLTFQAKYPRWSGWISTIVEFFGARLEEETKVEVDANGLVETREVFERYLPRGFKEVKDFEIGDCIFKRGRFSREAGYDSEEEWCCCPFD